MTTDDPDLGHLRVGVVGPCSAGKSTLIKRLERMGIHARHIAQEHSYVLNMWKRLTNPDILIFLDVSYPMSKIRRNLNWNFEEYQEQQRRLSHAREFADMVLMTDPLSEQEVLDAVLQFITARSPKSNLE